MKNVRKGMGCLGMVAKMSSHYCPVCLQVLPTNTMGKIEDVINSVCDRTGFTPDEIKGQSRVRDLAHARQMVMYICMENKIATSTVIGRALGGRDHSTVIHGRDATKKRLGKHA